MLKLDALNYLYQTYRFGSIRLAAESIPVAPSTISASLHKLEKEWGIQLLDRTYRGIRFAPAGERIAAAAKDLLEKSDEIEAIINEERGGGEEAASNEPITVLLARAIWQTSTKSVLAALQKEKRRIQLPDFNFGNEKCLKRVNEEQGTMLISYFKEPFEYAMGKYENIGYRRLSSGKPYIIAAKDSTLIEKGTRELAPEEAAKLPFARFTEGYSNNLEVFEMLESYGKVNIVDNFSSIQVLFGEVGLDHAVTVGCGALGDTEFFKHFQYIPIRTDMQLTLVHCYNKASSKEDRETIRRVFGFLF